MTAISYHDTVKELQGLGLADKGPFVRPEWFALVEEAGATPLIATARDDSGTIALALTQGPHGLEPLTNWYAFTWAQLATPEADPTLLAALARSLARYGRVALAKLSAADADALEAAFRQTGWLVRREVCDTNHYLAVAGRSFDDYLAARPGPLRTTLKRKAKKVEVRLSRQFDPADWAAYETIYAASWKPAEGDPALLRRFAEHESALGHYLFGMALADGEPVAAQFWTVEGGTAYIHKLAQLPSADKLSPGTTLTAALMEQAIDIHSVGEVDFGTGNDGYKADWMEATRPRYRLTCLRPGHPQNWPQMAKWALRSLVSPRGAG
ncbi:MAG: GNAT family N-acetyltransferase [Alteraurantiacibacter sp.]